MSWFWKKEKSLEEIFVDTLRNAEWEWGIADSEFNTWIIFRPISWKDITFKKIDYFRSYDTWYFMDERLIDESLFFKVKEIAEWAILSQKTKELGWYILDDDLREWINDAKKIMSAWEQIEMLTNVVEKIRDKYTLTK